MPRVRTVLILCVYRPISCLFVMYLCSPGRSVASATSTVLTTPTAPADTPSHSSWWREQRPRTSFDRHTRARNTHTHTTSERRGASKVVSVRDKFGIEAESSLPS
jgi:hypothetical protein